MRREDNLLEAKRNFLLEAKRFFFLPQVDLGKKMNLLVSRGFVFLSQVDDTKKILFLRQEFNFCRVQRNNRLTHWCLGIYVIKVIYVAIILS